MLLVNELGNVYFDETDPTVIDALKQKGYKEVKKFEVRKPTTTNSKPISKRKSV